MMAGQRRRLGGWRGPPLLFLAPAMILFAVLFAGPTVGSLYVSLCKWTGFTPRMDFTGASNFRHLLRDELFQKALVNNFRIMLAGGVVFFAAAMLFAGALNYPRFRGRKFFQTMIFFPAFVSAVGTAIFWKLLFDAKGGLINLTLSAAGAAPAAWLSPDNAIASITLVIVWAGVGGTMVLLLAGMRRIPRDYYEAAEVDGANALAQFRHVTAPMMREVLLIALSLWLIGSMKVFGYVQAMLAPTINPKCHVVSTLQYEYAFNNRSCVFLMGRATAIAVAQVAMVLILVAIVRIFRERKSVEY